MMFSLCYVLRKTAETLANRNLWRDNMNILNEIIEFKGRNYSGTYGLNYLVNHKNIYLMDNHKMALWCWLQKIDVHKKYNLLHIDRHTDTLKSRMSDWLSKLEEVDDISKLSPEEFSELKWTKGSTEDYVFTWGNYLSILLEIYPKLINELQMVTNNEGDFPDFENMIKTDSIWDFVNYFENIFKDKEDKWIINIDIDFFVASYEGKIVNLIADDALNYISKHIKKLNDEERIEVITISLSPECSGGWENSISIANKIGEALNLKIEGI